MTTTAQILTITGPRELGFIEETLPDPGPGDVLVRTIVSAISHGTEMNVYRGLAPQWRKYYDRELRLFLPVKEDEQPALPPSGYFTPGDRTWRYPLAYGYQNVGRVEQTGAGVDELAVGDLVYAYQAHRTAYVAPAASVIKLPALPDPAIGALYSNLHTAYGGVLDADIRIDDTVVVFGQGLVGLLVTQYLRNSGARQIIAVERIPTRRALSLKMGAHLCLDPAEQDVALAVRRLTNGRGADTVIEASGAYAALQEAIRTTAPNTTVVALSWYGGTGEQLALSDEFHHNRITIHCSQVGGIDPALGATHSIPRRAENILHWFSELELAPMITHRVPFADAARAYEQIDQRGSEVVQVVLDYGA